MIMKHAIACFRFCVHRNCIVDSWHQTVCEGTFRFLMDCETVPGHIKPSFLCTESVVDLSVQILIIARKVKIVYVHYSLLCLDVKISLQVR